MAFDLKLYPWNYLSQFDGEKWNGNIIRKESNSFPELPLINYTTQYGLGCFEGLKAYPQKKGGLKIFRPDQNAARMARSMQGLKMPSFPEDTFVDVVLDVVRRNQSEKNGVIAYNSAWEKDSYKSAESVYIRPFSYSEGGIGVNLSKNPYFIVVTTPVGAYFEPEEYNLCTSDMIRATPNGTGWIKAASNYTISALAKDKANENGFFEVLFLDSVHRKYIEECSSCNIFFRMKDSSLVTPALGDTILPGITRKSVIELAQYLKVTTTERAISIEEVFDDAEECFIVGTAVSLSAISSLTHNGKTKVFNHKKDTLSQQILNELKGIQHGTKEDIFDWMVSV